MTLALISDTAREWGKNEFHKSKKKGGCLYKQLAGFIGEEVVREYLEHELLLKAVHGPLYGNDLIVEDGIGVEVKTQTSLFAWKPTFRAWAPRYKPNQQDALIFTYMQIAEHNFASVLSAKYLRIRGWIADVDTGRYLMLAQGSDTPLKDGDTLNCDVLQVPDADLAPLLDFVKFWSL